MPGLVDLHAHLPPDNALRLTPLAGLLYLAHGVTSIRDAGDIDGTAIPAARRAFADGHHPGPRVFACGPFVGGGPPRWRNTIVLERPEDAEGHHWPSTFGGCRGGSSRTTGIRYRCSVLDCFVVLFSTLRSTLWTVHHRG